jgi:hypothetical protein
LVLCALVAPVVPAVFEAPVVVFALPEPPGVLELLPPAPPQPTEPSATAGKSSRVDSCRIESPLYCRSIKVLRAVVARAISIKLSDKEDSAPQASLTRPLLFPALLIAPVALA